MPKDGQRSKARRAFEDFRIAQATGNKEGAIAALRELDEIFAAESQELTPKELKFCLAYHGEAKGIGAEAARLAGYKGADLTLAVQASRMLNKANIQAFLRDLRLRMRSDAIATAQEVLIGLTEKKNFDSADLFEMDGSFDIHKAQRRGVSKFIKSISFSAETGRVTRIECYNAQEAERDLGKYHRLFPTKIELSEDTADKIIDEAAERHGLPTGKEFSM